MENQHRKITGYRDLTQEEINIMNDIKDISKGLGIMISNLKDNPDTDKRWVAEANTDLQKGIMCAVRAVAKSESF